MSEVEVGFIEITRKLKEKILMSNASATAEIFISHYETFELPVSMLADSSTSSPGGIFILNQSSEVSKLSAECYKVELSLKTFATAAQ